MVILRGPCYQCQIGSTREKKWRTGVFFFLNCISTKPQVSDPQIFPIHYIEIENERINKLFAPLLPLYVNVCGLT